MTVERDPRRVLLAAHPSQVPTLRNLFVQPELHGWLPCEADTPERVHFVLQHDGYDAILADESLWQGREHGLSWLLGGGSAGMVLLLSPAADVLTTVVEGGATLWLPRELALDRPRLLAAALEQAARRTDRDRHDRHTCEGLRDCHRRVARLLGMLWENAPVDGHTRWYSQRHMMERLQEELARVARHGGQFSLVVGEVTPRLSAASPDQTALSGWVSEHVHRLKRRCDVLGHYGPHGFLMLLPHTSEPGAAALCQRLRYSMEQTPPRPPAPVAAAFGLAGCADGRTAPRAILRRAEQHLEEAQAAVGLVS